LSGFIEPKFLHYQIKLRLLQIKSERFVQIAEALFIVLKSLPDIKRLRLGTVATAFQCDKKYHIFCDSKASWYSIFDEHHQYKENKTV